jgi:hypothetical protein
MPVEIINTPNGTRTATATKYRPETAFDLANVQYKAGLTDFLTVLDAQRELYANRDLLAHSNVPTGIGAGLTISPLGSAAAQGLPGNRYAVGGAFNAAATGRCAGRRSRLRVSRPNSRIAEVADFKRVFMLMIVCGVMTSRFAARIATKPGRPPTP